MVEQQIRIRDNGTVRRFKIPSDKLEGILKIQKSNVSDLVKENVIRKLLEKRSLCCICRGIPTREVSYKLEGATRIERYCDTCIKTVYEREQCHRLFTEYH